MKTITKSNAFKLTNMIFFHHPLQKLNFSARSFDIRPLILTIMHLTTTRMEYTIYILIAMCLITLLFVGEKEFSGGLSNFYQVHVGSMSVGA